MRCKLGDICSKIGSGATPRGGKEAYCTEGMSLIRSQNVLDFSFSMAGLAYINDTQARQLDNVAVNSNDVLLNITGDSVARACIVPANILPARVNQHVAIIRPDDKKADGKYILYFLQSIKPLLLQISSSGGTRNALTKSMIEGLEINLPSILEQKAVADTLSCLDDKIELNSRMNRILEETAQAIFKSWFVDYEPFQEGEFVDSELGPIPKGWRISDIYSIADIIYGAPFSSKLFNTEKNGEPIVRIRDLRGQELVTYTTEIHPKGYRLQPGDIVVGMDGEFRPYIWGNQPAWLNQRVCVFSNKRQYGKAFLLFTIKPQLDMVEKTELATTVIHIGKKDFDMFKTVLPPVEIFNRFDDVTSPIISRIVQNLLEIQALSQIRDSLLPKLMSGEIHVPMEAK